MNISFSRYKGIAFKSLSILLFFICSQNHLLAQVTLKGVSCVVPGTTYQYIVNAQWDSTSTMQACVTGGVFADGSTCTSSGKIMKSLLVIWNNNSSGKVSITSSKGNTTIQVNITNELNGGKILATDKYQNFITTNSSYFFHCSAATGGSCKPIYNYQWQKSTDMLQWENIIGATFIDLTFRDSIQVNTFFRRVVVDKSSTTIGYSDISQLSIVIPTLNGDSLHIAFKNTSLSPTNLLGIGEMKMYQKYEEHIFLFNEYVWSEKKSYKYFNI
jgi:hypothetical protein